MGGGLVSNDALVGGAEPRSHPGGHFSLPKAEGLSGAGLDISGSQMCSCLSGDTETRASEQSRQKARAGQSLDGAGGKELGQEGQTAETGSGLGSARSGDGGAPNQQLPPERRSGPRLGALTGARVPGDSAGTMGATCTGCRRTEREQGSPKGLQGRGEAPLAGDGRGWRSGASCVSRHGSGWWRVW